MFIRKYQKLKAFNSIITFSIQESNYRCFTLRKQSMTNLEYLLGDVLLYSVIILHIFHFYKFVSVYSITLVHPQPHKIHRRLNTFGCRKQDSLQRKKEIVTRVTSVVFSTKPFIFCIERGYN